MKKMKFSKDSLKEMIGVTVIFVMLIINILSILFVLMNN